MIILVNSLDKQTEHFKNIFAIFTVVIYTLCSCDTIFVVFVVCEHGVIKLNRSSNS